MRATNEASVGIQNELRGDFEYIKIVEAYI